MAAPTCWPLAALAPAALLLLLLVLLAIAAASRKREREREPFFFVSEQPPRLDVSGRLAALSDEESKNVDWDDINAPGVAAMCFGPNAADPAHCPSDCRFSEWSDCSAKCGGGTRTRTVAHAATNGGQPCPADAPMEQACNVQACAVDCEVSQWSPCSKPCGGGKKKREVTRRPDHGGDACPPPEELERDCNAQPCPVDCVVSDWGPCPVDCGGGKQTRRIVVQGAHGGKACPPPADLVRDCNTQHCSVDCQVSDWSPCSQPCGGGSQTRTVTRAAGWGGKECPPLKQNCNTQPCPVDCRVSDWSGCSVGCGGGVQTRSVTREAAYGGQACPPASDMRKTCNAQACPVDCQVSGWSGCSAGCGQGVQSRYVTRWNANGGAGCPNLQQACNNGPCWKEYRMQNRGNFCLDVAGVSRSAGGNLHFWDCWGGPNQQWRMDDRNRLVSLNSGMCLDVYGGNPNNGAEVVQWPCHDGANQKWYWDNGRLSPGHSRGRCLDAYGAGTGNGTRAIIWDCHWGQNQQIR